MAASKNAKSSAADKSAPKVRNLNGKEVKPVRYVGRAAGFGTYMAGTIDGKLVEGADGRPLPLQSIGTIS